MSVQAYTARSFLIGSILRRLPYFKRRTSYLIKYRIGGRALVIPIVNGQGLRHFWRFENETLAILKALYPLSQGAFVDVGANIGQTLLKIKAIEPRTEYIGFDPSPGCCAYLDLLIKENDFSNCTVLPVAVSDRRSIMQLYHDHSTDAAATTVAGFWTGDNRKSQQRNIIVDRGDDLIGQLTKNKIGIIKIDVEGGELEALSGLASTIAEHRPSILMEILPASCDSDSNDPATEAAVKLRLARIAKLVELLDEMQLVSYRLMPDGTLLNTRAFDSDKFVPELTNYLLIPRSTVLDFAQLSKSFQKEISAFGKGI